MWADIFRSSHLTSPYRLTATSSKVIGELGHLYVCILAVSAHSSSADTAQGRYKSFKCIFPVTSKILKD
ncbi:hypothetical protein XELAEV_18023193mg [Xenopus laevis]|uniref:Uncharacterized protein n=1 Tax=Xenopus laevis TaxID=8355 RepID=A0A974D6D6_XENLA|nr:hypothetical protein XELAEV_18023193mg [Xenopus laevis]